ncbi:hypothetical protein FHW69_001647 [Luteibacter sp. Sphag1AF]|nr:hypothetical protein [Luteibacter sp. Sphag1AF]
MRFTTDKPTRPGYYFVRGFDPGSLKRVAAVQVGMVNGELRVNLDQSNTDFEGVRSGYFISDVSEEFEWCELCPVSEDK